MIEYKSRTIATVEYILNLCFIILVVFTVFDGIRHYSYFSPYITRIKEIVILMLFIGIIFKNNFRISKKTFDIPTFIMMIYVTLLFPISFFTALRTDLYWGIGLHYKLIQFFMLMFIYYYYEEATGRKYESLFRLFVNTAIVFVFFNTISYFYHFPFMEGFRMYPGRISSGYPTMDAQMLCAALLINMLLMPRATPWMHIFKNIVLFCGIFLQFTGTGIASLGFIIVFYLAYAYFCDHNNRSANVLSILGSIALSAMALAIAFTVFKDEFQISYSLLTSKLQSILFMTGNVTLDIRENQLETIMALQKNLFDQLFGIGFAVQLAIENEYYILLTSIGYIGLGLFFIFLFRKLYLGWINRDNIGTALFTGTMLFVLSSYTNVSHYLLPVASSYALIFAFAQKKLTNRKIVRYSDLLPRWRIVSESKSEPLVQ